MKSGLIVLLSVFYILDAPLWGQKQVNAESSVHAYTEMAEDIYENAINVGMLWQVILPFIKEGEVRSSHWGDFIANTVWINVRFARVENLHVKEPEVFEKFCQEEQNTIRRRVKILSSFTKEETQMLFNLKMFATNKEVTQEVVNYLVKQKKFNEFGRRLSEIRNAYIKEEEIVQKILRGPL